MGQDILRRYLVSAGMLHTAVWLRCPYRIMFGAVHWENCMSQSAHFRHLYIAVGHYTWKRSPLSTRRANFEPTLSSIQDSSTRMVVTFTTHTKLEILERKAVWWPTLFSILVSILCKAFRGSTTQILTATALV